MTDGAGWVTVRGGLSQVDVDAVRLAAQNLDRASGALRNAALRLGMAAASVESMPLTARAPAGLGGGSPDDTIVRAGGPDAGPPVCAVDPMVVVQRALAEDVRALLPRLDADAERCAGRSVDLLKAAGLYEESETFAEKVVWGGSAALSNLVSMPGPVGWVVRGGALAGAGALTLDIALNAWWLDKLSGGWLSRWWEVNDDAVRAMIVRNLAPYTDDIVAGAAFGITTANPVRSRGDLTVPGAARVLLGPVAWILPLTAGAARGLAPSETSRLRELKADEPIDSITTALTRIETLYAYDKEVHEKEEDRKAGTTIAVQRVEHADGTTSWVVVIPGTNALLSATNPADLGSDIESAAMGTTDYEQAIRAALEEAHVGPDEPVVLVGHSLGGMVAQQLAGSTSFRSSYTVGGVVAAGSPTHYRVPDEIPVLSIVNDQEGVSQTDGLSAAEDAVGPHHAVIAADLAASPNPEDRAASGDFLEAHHARTHARTLDAARNDEQVRAVADPIEALMTGTSVSTTFYETSRVPEPNPAPSPAPSPGPTPVPYPAPPPGPVPMPLPVPGASPLLGTVAPLSASGASSGRGG